MQQVVLQKLVWITVLVAQALAVAVAPSRWSGRRDTHYVMDVPNQKGFGGLEKASGNPNEPLKCFEVTSPVLFLDGSESNSKTHGSHPTSTPCRMQLMHHVFGNSYGHPFVAKYTPPDEAECPFNRVIMNFTVVSKGRQFDRLAIMWLGDTEVWRTSTAEPKHDPGIAWTYWKDMTAYLSLWKQHQKLIFDLGNLINDKYTGPFEATLTTTFVHDGNLTGRVAPPANKIVPLSAGNSASGQGSAFTYPDQEARKLITLPRNVQRAVFSIAATGQSAEEFWWSNVPEKSIKNWNGLKLLGKGSFREVRLLIDGEIAGLSWPYPVVFTGGVSPPLHRPVVGPQAFDLKEQEIDITPWLGVLCDGKPHEFTLEVVGAEDLVVSRYWLLSGKIFLWLDDEHSITSGSAPAVSVSKLNYDPRLVAVPNKSLRYNQTISRNLEIRSTIQRAGKEVESTWSQRFSMRNTGQLLNTGNDAQVNASYHGEDKATNGEATYYRFTYSYPMYLSSVQKSPKEQYSFTLDANLTQSMTLARRGNSVFSNGLEPFLARLSGDGVPESETEVIKHSSAFFWQKNGGRSGGGFGSTHQTYKFGAAWAPEKEAVESTRYQPLYSREVTVVNETTTLDREEILGEDLARHGPQRWPQEVDNVNAFAANFNRWQVQS